MADGAVIRFGYVTNISDPHGGGRIQVRTPYDNTIKNDEELPYYFPLLPKMMHIVPKVGEMVLVFSMSPGDYNHLNFFIGPLISQQSKLMYEDAQESIPSIGYWGWKPNPEIAKGVKPMLYPAEDDISIEGRKDTGIQLKDEEVRVKAGVKVVDINGPKNNVISPAFISLKFYPDNDYELDGYKSTATIVADKINLLGTKTTDPETTNIPVTENKDMNAEEQDNLISDEAMKELVNKAHQVPFGDTLIDFLDLLRNALATHVHPFPTMAPCSDENMKTVQGYELDRILSDNVRIN